MTTRTRNDLESVFRPDAPANGGIDASDMRDLVDSVSLGAELAAVANNVTSHMNEAATTYATKTELANAIDNIPAPTSSFLFRKISASETLTAANCNGILMVTGSSSVIIKLPADAPEGKTLDIIRDGSGTVRVETASGAKINGLINRFYSIGSQGNRIQLVTRAAGDFRLYKQEKVLSTVIGQVANTAPTDIALSATSIPENTQANSVVATISTTDADSGDTHTYSITSDPDNKFDISGSNLILDGALDYATATSHSVTIRTTDAGGLTYDETFTITVNEVVQGGNSDSTAAFVMDGNDSYIEATDAPGVFTYPITLTARIKPTAAEQAFLSLSTAANSNSYLALRVDGTPSTDPRLSIARRAGGTQFRPEILSPNLYDGNEHTVHAVLTETSTTLYYDGAEVAITGTTAADGTASVPIDNTWDTFRLGVLRDDISFDYNGEIDNAGAFNVALTAAQISAMHVDRDLRNPDGIEPVHWFDGTITNGVAVNAGTSTVDGSIEGNVTTTTGIGTQFSDPDNDNFTGTARSYEGATTSGAASPGVGADGLDDLAPLPFSLNNQNGNSIKLTIPANDTGGITGSSEEIFPPNDVDFTNGDLNLLTYRHPDFFDRREDSRFSGGLYPNYFRCSAMLNGATTSGSASGGRSEFRNLKDYAADAEMHGIIIFTVENPVDGCKITCGQTHRKPGSPVFKGQIRGRGRVNNIETWDYRILTKKTDGGSDESFDIGLGGEAVLVGLQAGERITLEYHWKANRDLDFYVWRTDSESKPVNPTVSFTNVVSSGQESYHKAGGCYPSEVTGISNDYRYTTRVYHFEDVLNPFVADTSGLGADTGDSNWAGVGGGSGSNAAPTAMSISTDNIDENATAGSVVGVLSTIDADVGDTFTYAIVTDADSKFAISGSNLVIRAGATLDYETATSHDVTISTTDSGGLSYQDTFTITVNDVFEGAADISPAKQVYWFDFSDDTTVSVSGDTITGVDDKWSGAPVLVSDGTTTTPVYGARTINSLKAADFNNDILQAAVTGLPALTTVFMAVEVDSDPQFTFIRTDGTNFPLAVIAGDTTSPVSVGSGTPTYRKNGQYITLNTRAQASTLLSGGKYILTIENVDFSTSTLLSFGGNPTGDYAIGEVIMAKNLTAQEQIDIEQYLYTKWGIV